MNECREDDHRYADHPDHLEKTEKPDVEIKEDTKLHQREFEHNQPQASRDEKLRQLSFALPARKLQIRTGAGEKHEDWRAEVCDPACEEECNIRASRIGRIKLIDSVVNEVAGVV